MQQEEKRIKATQSQLRAIVEPTEVRVVRFRVRYTLWSTCIAMEQLLPPPIFRLIRISIWSIKAAFDVLKTHSHSPLTKIRLRYRHPWRHPRTGPLNKRSWMLQWLPTLPLQDSRYRISSTNSLSQGSMQNQTTRALSRKSNEDDVLNEVYKSD